MRFRGRELAHTELGLEMLKRLESDLKDYGTVEQFPRLEGKQMVMVLNPKSGAGAGKPAQSEKAAPKATTKSEAKTEPKTKAAT